MKKCFKCGQEKDLDCFYKHSQMGDGHLNKCIECAKKDANDHRLKNLERIREYDRNRAKLPHRKRIMSLRSKSYKIRKPLENHARCILNNAIRDGRILKPTHCSSCGIKPTRLFGHHKDYYKPLEVLWLCQPCHALEHKKLKALGD